MKPVAVLFIENAELQQVGGGGPKFEKGKVYDLAPDQAQRWYSRGKAVPAPAEAVEEPPAGITTKVDDATIVGAPAVEPDVSVSGLATIVDADLGAVTIDAGLSQPAVTPEAPRAPGKKGGKKS